MHHLVGTQEVRAGGQLISPAHPADQSASRGALRFPFQGVQCVLRPAPVESVVLAVRADQAVLAA